MVGYLFYTSLIADMRARVLSHRTRITPTVSKLQMKERLYSVHIPPRVCDV